VDPHEDHDRQRDGKDQDAGQSGRQPSQRIGAAKARQQASRQAQNPPRQTINPEEESKMKTTTTERNIRALYAIVPPNRGETFSWLTRRGLATTGSDARSLRRHLEHGVAWDLARAVEAMELLRSIGFTVIPPTPEKP